MKSIKVSPRSRFFSLFSHDAAEQSKLFSAFAAPKFELRSYFVTTQQSKASFSLHLLLQNLAHSLFLCIFATDVTKNKES
jgi:hypothetical protein